MKYTFNPSGVCSRTISFDIDENGVLTNLTFEGGCPGNTTGITNLANNRPAREVAAQLKGIDCRSRGTSCPDQLATAIDLALSGALENSK